MIKIFMFSSAILLNKINNPPPSRDKTHFKLIQIRVELVMALSKCYRERKGQNNICEKQKAYSQHVVDGLWGNVVWNINGTIILHPLWTVQRIEIEMSHNTISSPVNVRLFVTPAPTRTKVNPCRLLYASEAIFSCYLRSYFHPHTERFHSS